MNGNILTFATRTLIFVLVAGLSANAAAQTEEEIAQARTLFQEGVELMNQERFEDAAQRFRAVLEVRDTAQVRYNLALALERAGHLAAAAAILALVVEDRSLDRRMRREARELLASVQSRVARLTVRFEEDASGLSVTLDGREIAAERLGQPMVVNPGSHQLVVMRNQSIVNRQTVELAEGEASEVTLSGTAATPAVVQRIELDPELLETRREADRPTGGGSIIEEWWFWTLIGVVVIGAVAVGLGVGLSDSGGQPVSGNLMPGVIEVMLP